jgi:hypothetical protein
MIVVREENAQRPLCGAVGSEGEERVAVSTSPLAFIGVVTEKELSWHICFSQIRQFLRLRTKNFYDGAICIVMTGL